MAIPNKPGYTHGSSGTVPPTAIDWESGDPVDEAYFDYFIDTQFDYIKALIDALNAIDSNDDGKVDAADFADDATNATSTFKGNDIVDSNGVAFNTHQVEGSDGNYHSAGSLPQFSGTSTAITNTSEGDIFYITGDNSVYMNNGGSAINLTKKYVDILVNGGQEASYEQYDTNGDYDVSVSTSQSFNWQSLVDATRETFDGESSYTKEGEFSFNGYIYYQGNARDANWEIRDESDNSTVLTFIDGDKGTFLKENNTTYGVYSESDSGIEQDIDTIIDGATNYKTFTDKAGASMIIPTIALSVDNVSQTTNN